MNDQSLNELMRALPKNAGNSKKQLLCEAYEFANKAHKGKSRISGELYIHHDLAVAATVNQLGIDLTSTTAAMLHDILLPHTHKKLKQVTSKFGKEITSLITGLDKLDPYIEKSLNADDRQVEIIRRAILSIIQEDLRVVLIRMADALQDLKKASGLDHDTRLKVAEEAKNIYGPLANQLGIWQLKWQLEDLSFRYLQPQAYREIVNYLDEKRDKRNNSISMVIRRLQAELENAQIVATVSGRPKHVYSIYRKMQQKNLSFEEIYDVRAVRVIVESEDKGLCYQVLGIVHNLWMPIIQEFDDYIARPKANGYRSLHTAVADRQNFNLEVQIRTRSMHEEAERGIAAHWSYKEGGRHNHQLNQRIQVLRNLLNPEVEDNPDPTRTKELTLEDLAERIYVFTPKGDTVDLPAGATPIDFAYYIHTEIGHRCRGAKVNGKMVRLDHKLKNGDRVEIQTTNRGGPSRDWMNESLGFTGSARTRSRVRRWFRLQEREKNIEHGRSSVLRELKRLGLSNTMTLADIAESLEEENVDDFLAKIGFGDIQASSISGAISRLQKNLRDDDDIIPLLTPQKQIRRGLTVKGLSGLHTRIANCCNPVPPEEIIGFTTRGRGVTVHSKSCSTIQTIGEKERLIEVNWGEQTETYPIPIVIHSYNRPGIMHDITNILKGRNINMTKTKATTDNDLAVIYLVVEVVDLTELGWLLQRLDKLPNVLDVQRQRWNGV